MSRNKDIESKIEVVDELVAEMRNHRDQAVLFKGALDALEALNKEIKSVDAIFDGLNANAIHERFDALEKQRDGVRDQLAEFKGEFKGLVDGISARVSTLKDDIASVQKSVQEGEKHVEEQFKQAEAQSLNVVEKINTLNREVSARIEDSREAAHLRIETSESKSLSHMTEVSEATLYQLKEENEAMDKMIKEHFETIRRWVIFVAVVGAAVAGVTGYLLYLALSVNQ